MLRVDRILKGGKRFQRFKTKRRDRKKPVGVRNGEIYNGADDDASGTSALFALAEYFKKNPPKHSIVLAAFDAEELGLRGAAHFLEANTIAKENIALNINLDTLSPKI